MYRLPIRVERDVRARPKHESAAVRTDLIDQNHGGDVARDIVHMHVVTVRRANRGWEYTVYAAHPTHRFYRPADEAPHNALYFWVIGDPINQ